MGIHIGIDIGAIGLKTAGVLPRSHVEQVALPEGWRRLEAADAQHAVLIGNYRRTKGRPMESTRALLVDLIAWLGADGIASVTLTGSGSDLAADALGLSRCNEFQAIARAIDLLHPDVRTVFEMGGETSKYLRLRPDPGNGTLGIADYSTNGDCAAGTGAFLDQQAGRLQYEVNQIGDVVEGATRSAAIAGRCSVFAKSDMIHAQQKGFTPPEVLRGLCRAVAANFRSAVVKGRAVEAPIALLGGVSANRAVVNELRSVFGLEDGQLFVPDEAASLVAVGAALIGKHSDRNEAALRSALNAVRQENERQQAAFSRIAPLTLDRVTLLRDQARPYTFPQDGTKVPAYLGLDIGSVGTKLVLIDDVGDVVHFIFTRTEGRPIEVVTRCLRELEMAVGDRIHIRGVGTTGSGRELIGELVGADAIHDEITCHKTGASLVGDRLLGKRPDTIFEIGGQDSKYISLQSDESGESIVVDFTMNEACAAGTGSFLEERAEELGVSIKDEFAEEALRSTSPIKLGERCTVFMERDVNTCMLRGAKREDVIAGLAYSVVYNYINRVVRGRYIGDCIFFQGGTAYNDAVTAAFSAVTGKEIIVPPHNAVLGAIGAALLSREKVTSSGMKTRFRGYDMTQVDYSLREFTCKGCGNECSVQEFKVEGEKTFWGDKCSDRFRKQAKTDKKATIPDLVALRKQLLAEDEISDPADPIATVGLPLGMYTHDLLPMWRRFFRACGFAVRVSDETNRRIVDLGSEAVVAEPCFPIIVAHGHVAELFGKGVDYVWVPNIMSAETKFHVSQTNLCPWGQTLPFVVRQSPALAAYFDRILCPTIRLQHGLEHAREPLVRTAVELGVSRKRARHAFDQAVAAQRRFRERYQTAGRQALDQLIRTGEPGMILVGRPYNVHDPGVSLSTARKLRENYGVNVIPIDALQVEDVDISDVNRNMFWEYGRRILAVARLVGEHPNLHIIFITNFKCGPDSFIKGFVRDASGGKPFLTLQFDGHSNDAGMMTRCEAYLDSKGILRWWRKPENEPADPSSMDGGSTSPKWHMPAPGSSVPHSDPSVLMPPPRRTPTPTP